MNKILKRYRIVVSVLILIISLLFVLDLNFKIKLDKFELLDQVSLRDEDEFRMARENQFVQLKNDLLDRDIILDNISIGNENEVKFDIYKTMYPDQLNDFIKFLNDVPYLRIIDMSIIKNKFDYNINISAEI